MKKLCFHFGLLTLLACNNTPTEKIIPLEKFQKLETDSLKYERGSFHNSHLNYPLFKDCTGIDQNIKTLPNADSTAHYTPRPQKLALKIRPHNIVIKPGKRIYLEGTVHGDFKNIHPADFEIFIGHRRDTIVSMTYMSNNERDEYFQGKKIESDTIFAVPAFYMAQPAQFEISRARVKNEHHAKSELQFKVESVIDENSALVFSHYDRYATIFSIGQLLEENKTVK
jgi:hypothetical protein